MWRLPHLPPPLPDVPPPPAGRLPALCRSLPCQPMVLFRLLPAGWLLFDRRLPLRLCLASLRPRLHPPAKYSRNEKCPPRPLPLLEPAAQRSKVLRQAVLRTGVSKLFSLAFILSHIDSVGRPTPKIWLAEKSNGEKPSQIHASE